MLVELGCLSCLSNFMRLSGEYGENIELFSPGRAVMSVISEGYLRSQGHRSICPSAPTAKNSSTPLHKTLSLDPPISLAAAKVCMDRSSFPFVAILVNANEKEISGLLHTLPNMCRGRPMYESTTANQAI